MASRVLGENLPAVVGQGNGWVANDQHGFCRGPVRLMGGRDEIYDVP